MKRTYIKPLCEELFSNTCTLLAGSSTQSKMGNDPIDNISNPNPGAREFGDDFFEEDDEY